MYMGAGLVLGGAALFDESAALLVYAGVFLVITHVFVVWYEEPALRRTFKQEDEMYCCRVSRWRPRLRRGSDPDTLHSPDAFVATMRVGTTSALGPR
jgi:protein-S-isoprenylcysteine O-methyltransferase Ste14